MLTNCRTVRIEWGDCDPAGIVFFPRYFQMLDASTTALFERALGMTKFQFLKAYGIIGYPVVDVRARFILPSRFSDVVEIETTIGELRRSSFLVNHRLLKDGELALEGSETRVWAIRDETDPDRIRSHPIPPDVIARLTAS
jgi:4-hydroxybenzoyl-CoA thioesterase